MFHPTPSLRDRLSVVLLTHDCAHRLDAILDRLLELDVPVIAVDNASSDETVRVLTDRPGIAVVPLTRNIGAAGRTVGAERATTPYVAFCDDDGWYERDGLELAADLLDDHPELAVVNARILVGDEERLDPISAEMMASPLVEDGDIPGSVLLSFMGGAAIMRRTAFLQVGGYDRRYFMGGEEETVAMPLAKAGWRMRYIHGVVMHHLPSLENAMRMRAFGMRNTIVASWLHRPAESALRWTAFTLADTPKNRDFAKGLLLTIAAIPWMIAARQPMSEDLDHRWRILDARRTARRRPFFTARAWRPGDAAS